MMTETETQTEPQTTCGHCSETDNEPKHMIAVGYSNPATDGNMFHEHDTDRDGVIHYHFNCPTPFHASSGHGEYHAKLAALIESGVRGDALRARILEGTV